MKKIYILLVTAAALLLVVYLFRHAPGIPQTMNTMTAETPTPCEYHSYPINVDYSSVLPPVRIPPDGLARYRNEKYRFSLFYPADEKAQEYPEIGGAETIVFQNPQSLEGFQIFIVPYKNPGIVPRRIQKDVPNGMAIGKATTTVDGVCAASFATHDSILPDTVEVWIPKDGYLYEITAYAGQEDQLKNIVDSWRFLSAI